MSEEELQQAGNIVYSDIKKAIVAFTKDVYDSGHMVINQYLISEEQRGDSGNVLLRIKDLKRLAFPKARERFPLIRDSFKSDYVPAVLLGVAEIVGVIKGNEIVSNSRPLDLLSSVYYPSIEKITKLLKTSNGVVVGKGIFGYVHDNGELNIKPIDVYVDTDRLISEGVLVLGAEKSGKTMFMKKLLKKLTKHDKNLNVIIFDINGEYAETKGLKNVEVVDGSVFDKKIDFGFGFDYMDYKEIVSYLSSKLSYGDIRILANMLKKAKENNIEEFLLSEEVMKKISEDGQEVLETIIKNNAKEYLEPGKIVIVELSKGLRIIHQAQIIGKFFRDFYDELIRRNERNENVRRLIVVENLERFAPKKGYEETDVVTMTREYIINLVAQTKFLKTGVAGLTSYPSMLSEILFYYLRNRAITKILDDLEIESIKKNIGITPEEINSINFGEYLIMGPFLPQKFKIKVVI